MLTITSTSPPATDLGFLLHKHPDRLHTVELAFGKAQVFYPEAGEERCTAARLLDVDPVGLVRRAGGKDAFPLAEYVSDRPYAASSFLSVAISRVFGTALGGRCAKRPELPDQKMALTATIAPLPCRGGEAVLRSLFEPLGYGVTAASVCLVSWPSRQTPLIRVYRIVFRWRLVGTSPDRPTSWTYAGIGNSILFG